MSVYKYAHIYIHTCVMINVNLVRYISVYLYKYIYISLYTNKYIHIYIIRIYIYT